MLHNKKNVHGGGGHLEILLQFYEKFVMSPQLYKGIITVKEFQEIFIPGLTFSIALI